MARATFILLALALGCGDETESGDADARPGPVRMQPETGVQPVADSSAPVGDVALVDAAPDDAAHLDGPVPDARLADAAIDGALPDSALPDVAPDAALPDAAADVPPADAAPDIALPDAAPRTDLTGTWIGTYDCAQGATDLELVIEHADDDTLVSEFAFSATPENPDVPDGRFVLTGVYQPPTAAVRLQPSHWIDEPDGFIMVGLNGRYLQDPDRIEGVIDNDGCGDFSVSRR